MQHSVPPRTGIGARLGLVGCHARLQGKLVSRLGPGEPARGARAGPRRDQCPHNGDHRLRHSHRHRDEGGPDGARECSHDEDGDARPQRREQQNAAADDRDRPPLGEREVGTGRCRAAFVGHQQDGQHGDVDDEHGLEIGETEAPSGYLEDEPRRCQCLGSHGRSRDANVVVVEQVDPGQRGEQEVQDEAECKSAHRGAVHPRRGAIGPGQIATTPLGLLPRRPIQLSGSVPGVGRMPSSTARM